MELPLAFKTFAITRHHLVRELKDLSHEQLLTIPDGREDNILWNLGHVTCSLARLTYARAGRPLPLPEEWLGLMGKDTRATDWTSPPDIEEVLLRFRALPPHIEADYKAGKFTTYEPLQITPQHTIDTIEEAIAFHCFHEGLHIGYVLTLKQLLADLPH